MSSRFVAYLKAWALLCLGFTLPVHGQSESNLALRPDARLMSSSRGLEAINGGSGVDCDEDGSGDPVVQGERRKWHPLTVVVDGPCTDEEASPNPFLYYRFSVTFRHQASGRTVTVPGYFAADGDAANTSASSGTTWHAHFTPRRTGTWTFETSFREGRHVAINEDPEAGTTTAYDGQRGEIAVKPTDKAGRDHRGKGMLKYEPGERYLRFDDGTYFLKGGTDAPENLLAYSDFDGTTNRGGTDYIRAYEPHLSDWSPGDPTWKGERGKGLIGALNYLASEKLNAFSFLTMNVRGDGDDVWPWIDPEATLRYDISKLAQWEMVFRHADSLGLFKHVKTQETENDQYLDDGDLGTERKLYYRELVARFAHHHSLNWNLGEEYDVYREKNEENQDRLKSYAAYIRALDPYDHPIVVHTYPDQKDDVYSDLLGEEAFTGPSLQLGAMDPREANETVQQWVSASVEAGRVWNVSVDEPGTAQAGLQPDSDPNYEAARAVMWAVYLAGGDGLEWYFGYEYPHHDLNAADWRSRDQFWDYQRYALALMEELPLRTMTAANQRLAGEEGVVLSDAQDWFVAYLPEGGTAARLSLPSGSFDVQWYDPRSGGSLQTGAVSQVEGDTTAALGAPPSDDRRDWVVVVSRSGVELQQNEEQ